MTKTNVMRLLEAAGIAYRTAEYEYDEANLSGLHAAEQVGMDAEQVFFKEPTIPPEVANRDSGILYPCGYGTGFEKGGICFQK